MLLILLITRHVLQANKNIKKEKKKKRNFRTNINDSQ